MALSDEVRCIISIRVSSDDQLTKGWSHGAQLRRLPELAREQGWTIATRPDGTPAIYDEGASSTTAPADGHDLVHRPIMRELIADLPHTRPTWLVCHKLDRLHRNSLQWEFLAVKLLAAGAEGVAQFTSMQGPPELRNLGNDRDRLFASIEAGMAALEKSELREKLMVGRRARAELGLPNGGPAPYGYERIPFQPKEPLRVNAEEKANYLLMVELARQGHGAAFIARRLNDEQIPTRSGAQWTASTVRKILLSQAPLGRFRASFSANKGGTKKRQLDLWVEGRHEPLISEEDWAAMQAVGADRREGRPRGASNRRKHALAGLLRCSSCGKTLKARVNRKTVGGERREYWHYTCKIYNSGCPAGYTISERRALKELGEHLDARLAATDAAGWIEPATTHDLAPLERRLERLVVKEKEATKRYDRAAAHYESAPDATVADAARRLQLRERELEAARAELAEARRSLREAIEPAPAPPAMEELRAVLDDWRSFDDNDKRAVLEAVIEKAVLMPPGRARRLEVFFRE